MREKAESLTLLFVWFQLNNSKVRHGYNFSILLSPERDLRVQTSKLSCDPKSEICLKVIPSIIISLTSNLSLFSKIPKTDRYVLKTHFVHTCAPLWHPVRSETKTKGDLYAQVQPKTVHSLVLLGMKNISSHDLGTSEVLRISDQHPCFVFFYL